jgi:hypothetical protein
MIIARIAVALTAALLALPTLAVHPHGIHALLNGPGAEVDPGFPYYAGRSAESIASEIRANGYKHVHYVVTTDSAIRGDLIRAFHKEGLPVWYLTFCHVAYSTLGFPKGWESWKMVYRDPKGDEYTRLCMTNPGYIAFKLKSIAESMRKYPFDGVELVEPFWPDAPGPSAKTYGCLCAHCRAAFLSAHPEEKDLPEFNDPASPRWYKADTALYKKWVDFRVKGINHFLSSVLDGPGGIRRLRPKTPTMVWCLVQDSPNAVETLREAQGDDAGEMARDVHPSAVCLQTNWMDWSKANLSPDYVKAYEPFVQRLRKLSPGTPFTFQVDMGSLVPSRQTYAWLKRADAVSRAMGALGTVNYEYFITKSMYDDPPRLAWVRNRPGGVSLVFQKRVDAGRVNDASNYHITGLKGEAVRVVSAKADGNIVRLTARGMRAGRRYRLSVDETVDTPELWLFKRYPKHTAKGIKAVFTAE